MDNVVKPSQVPGEPIPQPAEGQELETPQAGDAAEPIEKQYVTQDQLSQIMEDTVKRIKQSDKARQAQINDRLNEITTMLTKAGTPPTTDQANALREQIADSLEEVEQPQPQAQQAGNQLDVWLNEVFTQAGAAVSPSDPEWKDLQASIDSNWDNPKGMPAVLVAATKAAETKAARIATMQESATARVSGGDRKIQGEPPATSAAELWKRAYKT